MLLRPTAPLETATAERMTPISGMKKASSTPRMPVTRATVALPVGLWTSTGTGAAGAAAASGLRRGAALRDGNVLREQAHERVNAVFERLFGNRAVKPVEAVLAERFDPRLEVNISL